MTHQQPPAPPEADVIKLARLAARLTVDEAVARVRAAGGKISVTYWRDVERGNGGRRGTRVLSRASGNLLAQMAHATGVTPAQLRDAARGHPDGEDRARVVEQAAVILEEILRREGHAAPGVPRSPGDLLRPLMSAPELRHLTPYVADIERRIMSVQAGQPLTGRAVFPGPGEEWLAGRWDAYARERTPDGNTWSLGDLAVALALVMASRARQASGGERRTG